MTNRPWPIAIVFILALAVVLAALAWTSATVLRLDAAEATARRQADFEENVRLALWRMDSAAAPLVAQEGARPFAAFRPFMAVVLPDASTKDEKRQPASASPSAVLPSAVSPSASGELWTPSPLLSSSGAFVLLHFQIGPDGQLTSPQSPCGDARQAATASGVATEQLDKADARLAELCELLDRERLISVLPPPAEPIVASVVAVVPSNLAANSQVSGRRMIDRENQQARGANEFQVRSQYVTQNSTQQILQNPTQAAPFAPDGAATSGLMKPLWLGDRLLLARQVIANGATYVQGCWLDWQAVEAWLTSQVSDLLPDAKLVAAPAVPGEEPARLLAALPVRLVPGEPPLESDAGLPALQLSLAVAWGCVLLAGLAVAVLLLGVVTLSERRGAFVSAVTHELRTPLTTFRMYAEMLAEGMVPEAAQRERYLNTLRVEAERLTHLVENVLAYARLERGRARGRVEVVAVEKLLAQVEGRLRGRAEQAGMALVVEIDEHVTQIVVRTDASAVEQVLFNLVDNACKYAAMAADRRIHLVAATAVRAVELRVGDHGPGIMAAQARRLFRPFSKSAADAANSAPGVGLGLALSRRLAREMGGELKLEHMPAFGTCFVLSLPIG